MQQRLARQGAHYSYVRVFLCHFAALCVQLPRTAAELNTYGKGVLEAAAPAAEAGWRTVDVDVAASFYRQHGALEQLSGALGQL